MVHLYRVIALVITLKLTGIAKRRLAFPYTHIAGLAKPRPDIIDHGVRLICNPQPVAFRRDNIYKIHARIRLHGGIEYILQITGGIQTAIMPHGSQLHAADMLGSHIRRRIRRRFPRLPCSIVGRGSAGRIGRRRIGRRSSRWVRRWGARRTAADSIGMTTCAIRAETTIRLCMRCAGHKHHQHRRRNKDHFAFHLHTS